MSPLLPELLAIRRAGDQVSLDLIVPPELAHFAGHFPVLPILPGVVQIDWAIGLARQHADLTGSFSALENIKFQAPVKPGARLELNLHWQADQSRLDFSYRSGQSTCSSGRIVMSGAA